MYIKKLSQQCLDLCHKLFCPFKKIKFSKKTEIYKLSFAYFIDNKKIQLVVSNFITYVLYRLYIYI